MLKNYFKIAIRSLLKNKFYSAINIGGMALGLIAVLLMVQYVQYEFSYDAHLSKAGQLFRLNVTSLKNGNFVETGARTSPPMGSSFSREIGAVESFTRVVILGEAIVGHDDNFVREKDIFLVDDRYHDFFDLNISQGSARLMNEPMKVMISDQMAQRIFQDANPVGEILGINSTNFDGTVDFEIAGVFQSTPQNSHLRPQVLISYATLHQMLGKQIDDSYPWLNLYTYLKLGGHSDIGLVEEQVNASLQKHYGKELESTNTAWQLNLLPITDIHTNMAYVGEHEQGVDGKKLQYFLWIAAFILVMIYMNSINITNAKAMSRSKEIGVRKVSGGTKRQLFFQFMFEALLVNFIAIGIALIAINGLGAFLVAFFDLDIPSDAFSLTPFYLELFGFWLFSSLITGLYPSTILAAFSAAKALKGTLKFKLKGGLARPLTITQLVSCVVILAGTFTVYFQVVHMRQQELGMSMENKVVVRSPMLFVEGSGTYQKIIHQEFTRIEGVTKVAATNEIPGNEVYWRSDQFYREGAKANGTMYTMLNVGDHYFDVFDIHLKSGRYFYTDREEGSEAIINEKARIALGFETNEAALGEKLMYENFGVEIVGVVDDFRQQGVNKPIEPLVLNYASGDLNYYIVAIDNSKIEETLAQIGATFKRLFPASPLEYFFLDAHFEKQYKSEKQFARLFYFAAVVAIIIAIMGIVGVTTQLIIQRNKEVSVRKILGATVGDVFQLISKEFIYWLLICYAIAIPLSYFLFSQWLNHFLVRIDLGWWFFTIPALLVALIFILSTVFQTLKVALINPAKTLKDE